MPSIPLGLDARLLRDVYSVACRTLHTGAEAVMNTPTTSPMHNPIIHDTSLERRASGLGNVGSVNSTLVLAQQQRHTIQLIAVTTSGFSITAAICAIYWFCMMRRNYRRDLVFLLILGDFWKSLWLVIYGGVTFATGQVASSSRFCQASGYLLQVGLSAGDAAILLISMHMTLQIFPPTWSFLGHDGLYHIRQWVFAAWILVPNLMASLALINPEGGYAAAGAFCSLPLRPFWYRLALSWIPRYLIWMYIVGVAIRIYKHVGYEFKVFGQAGDKSYGMDMTAQSSVGQPAAAAGAGKKSSISQSDVSNEKFNDEKLGHDPNTGKSASASRTPPESTKSAPFKASQSQSVPSWPTAFGGAPAERGSPLPGSRSNPTSRRGSRQIAPGVAAEDFMPLRADDFGHHRGSVGSIARSMTAASLEGGHALVAMAQVRASTTTGPSLADNPALHAVQQRREAIQRQLRLLFIYPVVYTLLWTIPLVSHCMSYSDRYAQHPVFQISALSTFCIPFLGFADVCVFCWREKPWRHIPGSDGTFSGSFYFWRFCRNPDWVRRKSRAVSVATTTMEREQTQSQAGLLASLKRWSTSRKGSSPRMSQSSSRPTITRKQTNSGGSERQMRESDQAHQRLAMERADYERELSRLQERRASATIQRLQQQPGNKDWFDGRLSEDLLSPKDMREYDGEV